MKKIVTVFGLISGTISAILLVIGMSMTYKNPDYGGGMVVGYASMLISFSLIFVGIKNYRDKYNNGVVTFGKAFTIGLYIALIASTMYVATWAIQYHFFMPDFMTGYSAHMIAEAGKSGDPAEVAAEIDKIKKMMKLYENPLFFTLMTYAEILPVGIVVSLIAAGILRRKPNIPANDGMVQPAARVR